ncbi:Hemicentin-2 [Papilio machaon]|uniref:Hemicentin-2 n=1 Tax=Papilio machaon TaxID=76193 RepID=A0A0N1IPC9_PAPMA|nr:Hemicentin-2 [Papilio machaon]
MSADIKNVLNSTDGLFDAVVNTKKSEIENFVLVTFNDPVFELRIITDKRDEFKTSLRSLRVSGGGDCPEMAMSGIELGLQKGRPYSYLFVFTDATAKDMYKFERIMKYVMKLVDSRKVDIKQKQFNATDDKKVVVPLDPSIGTAIISVSSGNSSLNVKDKDNTTVGTEEIAKTENIKMSNFGRRIFVETPDVDGLLSDRRSDPTFLQQVVLWNNTNPGDYTVEINSTTNTLVTIHGTTKVTFNYGFSVTKPNYFNETTNRPVADQKSYILIKLNTEGIKLNLQRLQFVDLKDNILFDKVKFVAQEDHYYLTEPINFPKDTFKIVMIAEDEKTKNVLKRASLPIESQKVLPGTMENEAPAVTIFGATKVKASTGKPLQLKCRVTGYPKPKISWEDAFGTTLTSTVSTVREEYEYLNVLNIEKVHQSTTYICKASNIISSDEKIVEVDTGDRFAVVKFSKDKKIEYNKEEKLFCKVNADPPANVLWYLNGNQVEANDDFDISPDKSTLTIKKMKQNYIGTVLCEVRNSVKRLMYNMKLSMTGDVGPEIDKKTTEIFVIEGSSAIVSCRILKGNPKPMINWTFKSKNNDTFYDIKEYNEDIRIEKVSTNDVGTYKCVAKNDISEDSHILDLTIEYAPVVLGQSNIDINQQIGQKILISCDIKGEPEPFISWFLNGLMIVESELYQIDKDNTLTFEASIKTMGQYSCEGVNKFGSIKKIANVSVFEPLKIDLGETNITIEVGRQLSLSCPVKGYPKPKIQWTFMPLYDLELRNLSSSNAQLQIPEFQTSDSGYYVCTVTISGDEKTHLFVVNVKEPIKSTPKKIVAVDGDPFLKIPCESAAEPKSTISWFKNGAPITVGNEWHTLESDGSLIIKDIKTPTAGIYDCANHDRSKVYESFEVNVAMHPDANNLNYNIEYFIENKNGTVPCKVAQATTDYILWWYKV